MIDKHITIRDARISAGLTQNQLATKTGLNRSQIQKLESGDIKIENITARNLFAIADALGVDPRELLEVSP